MPRNRLVQISFSAFAIWTALVCSTAFRRLFFELETNPRLKPGLRTKAGHFTCFDNFVGYTAPFRPCAVRIFSVFDIRSSAKYDRSAHPHRFSHQSKKRHIQFGCESIRGQRGTRSRQRKAGRFPAWLKGLKRRIPRRLTFAATMSKASPLVR